MTAWIKACLLGVSWVMRCLPHRLRLWLGDALGLFVGECVRFRRSLVEENLRLAFGSELGEREIRRLARANYRNYGRLFFDFLSSISWGPEDFRRHVRFEGMEHVEPLLREGRGLFFLTFHMGSWELALGAAASQGIPIDAVVKHARNPIAEDLLQWYRRRSGAGVYLESGSHHQILQSLGSGHAVAYLLDQFMGPPIGLPVTFFGKLAGTAVSLALLLERREVPVVLGYMYRDAGGRLRIRLERPFSFPDLPADRTERLYRRTQAFNDAMEAVVRRYPEQWLWLHRRWKPYRGEPRWKPKAIASIRCTLLWAMSVVAWRLPTATAMAALMLTLGCAGRKPEETGIALPPDPAISVPEFREAPAADAPGPAVEHAQAMGILDKPAEKPAGKGAKPKKGRKVETREAAAETPTPQMVEFAKLPFAVGERMEIDLVWMALPAGRVVMEVRKGERINGRETLHLWGNVLSSKLVDTIYHVDNTIESFVDAKGLIPYKFLLHMVETSQKKETRVAFDHKKGKAYYWSKRVSQKWGDENLDLTDNLLPSAKDMYSGLYYLRTLDYRLNKPVRFPVYEKSKNMYVIVTPVAQNEIVTTKTGVFQCWKLAIQVELNNNLQQTGESFLWVSDDSKRYLVKFDAKIKIGSLKGTLVDLKER